MPNLTEHLLYVGCTIELRFTSNRPTFGDLLTIVGEESPAFPANGARDWAQLIGLGFEQVDDYFALNDDEGEPSVWLFPVLAGEVVDHHAGPFDALRFEYSVVRNPPSALETLIRVIVDFSDVAAVAPFYVERDCSLGMPPDLAPLIEDVQAVIAYWRAEGIEPGSDEALEVEL